MFPARPRTQHDCHHDTKVKPEAATAVIELLMMGGRTPETCWVVNKRQDNKLENCCIWLVIYLNCTMMHRLTNLKFMSSPPSRVWHRAVCVTLRITMTPPASLLSSQDGCSRFPRNVDELLSDPQNIAIFTATTTRTSNLAMLLSTYYSCWINNPLTRGSAVICH